jgi:hypothetical protein
VAGRAGGWLTCGVQLGFMMGVVMVCLPSRAAYLLWEVHSRFRELSNEAVRIIVGVEVRARRHTRRCSNARLPQAHMFFEWMPSAAMLLLLRTVHDRRASALVLASSSSRSSSSAGIAEAVLAASEPDLTVQEEGVRLGSLAATLLHRP